MAWEHAARGVPIECQSISTAGQRDRHLLDGARPAGHLPGIVDSRMLSAPGVGRPGSHPVTKLLLS